MNAQHRLKLVGDEVTSLILFGKCEPPHVGSYSLRRDERARVLECVWLATDIRGNRREYPLGFAHHCSTAKAAASLRSAAAVQNTSRLPTHYPPFTPLALQANFRPANR